MDPSSTAWFAIQIAELGLCAAIFISLVVVIPLLIYWRSLHFNQLWRTRVLTLIACLIWPLVFHLRSELLFYSPSSLIPVSTRTQAALCLSYVAGSYGLAEPLFACVVLLQVALRANKQRDEKPPAWFVKGGVLLAVPGIAAAVTVVVLNLVPNNAPAFVFSTFDSTVGICQTPLISVAVNAAMAVIMVPLFNLFAQRVYQRLVNTSLQRRLRAVQVVFSIVYSASAALRVSLPYVPVNDSVVILHVAYALIVFCSFLVMGIFVLHPLRAAVLSPLDTSGKSTMASPIPKAASSLEKAVRFDDVLTVTQPEIVISGSSPQRYLDNSDVTTPSCTPTATTSEYDTTPLSPVNTPAGMQQSVPAVTPHDPRYRPRHDDKDAVRVSETPFEVRVERAIERELAKTAAPRKLFA